MTLHSNLGKVAARLDETIEDVLRDEAARVVRAAKIRVPVSQEAKPHLRDAIRAERISDTEYRVVAGDTERWYGHIVEHGSKRMPPRPFLQPAFESRKPTIMKRAAAAVTLLGKRGR